VIFSRRTAAALIAALIITSYWTVYTRYVDLRAFEPIVGQPYRELSLQQYRDTLAGTMSFPAQWRLLAFWIVAGTERAIGLDPHVADLALKTAVLAATTFVLAVFANRLVGLLGVVLVAALYLLANAIAYAPEGYAIYHSNDYLLVLGWFIAVYALRDGRWALAAAAIFVAAWAKESIVLAVALAALEAWRGRLSWAGVAACTVAFVIPTAIIRSTHPAPIEQWAWWEENLKRNLPFYSSEPGYTATALRNDLKVLLFLHVAGFVSIRAWLRTRDQFLRSLGIVLVLYVCGGVAVFMYRELRHFLPVLILVVPLTVAELERALSPRHASGLP
jgi:hypothetical protein